MTQTDPTDTRTVHEKLPDKRDAIEDLVGEHVIATDDHHNAPGIVIDPESVQDTLSTLRRKAGFDHLCSVTAQEYPDRYESIYTAGRKS